MMKVLGAVQSRRLEERAVQAGANLLDLMENAGGAAVRFLRKKYDTVLWLLAVCVSAARR